MALSLTPAEFIALFPPGTPSIEIADEHFGDLQLSRNALVPGVVHGDLWILKDVSAEITGIVHGSVAIEKGGVAYIAGTVNGTLLVEGAAAVTGTVEGDLQAADTAVISVTGSIANRRSSNLS